MKNYIKLNASKTLISKGITKVNTEIIVNQFMDSIEIKTIVENPDLISDKNTKEKHAYYDKLLEKFCYNYVKRNAGHSRGLIRTVCNFNRGWI